MKSNHRTVLVVLFLALVATAPAAAQESTTSTTTSTPNSTVTSSPDQNASTVQVIGPLTRITEWDYSDGTFRLTIEAKAPTLLTVTEAVTSDSSGTGTGTLVRKRLSKGTNVVRINVQDSSNPALSLTTPGSIENNEYAWVKVETSSSLIGGPFDGTDVRDAAIGGALAIVIAVLDEAVAAKVGSNLGLERLA
ncbi:hypothetical protein SAMN04487949_1767 [Halogranum gelatinilyticum]|uniref:Uncharacterized protein n=1 Tax=Halogranum gelatinilyticum TaxID=660521 RepID=A0A1G9TGP9_9EURY|nr:hypothetical protein [Halogranum gelatinilyticum]SDM46896.1 hypothetical protein SAMN04487949_1767 [Halogranum gelatinilyticum]